MGSSPSPEGRKFALGLVVGLRDGPAAAIARVRSFDFSTCQVIASDPAWLTDQNARALRDAARTPPVTITTIWSQCRPGQIWNPIDGPSSVGLVPAGLRALGVAALKRASDFAKLVGVPSITTHVGFIPENARDPDYAGVVEAIAEVAAYCRGNGQRFWLETGQETPITLRRAIEDSGTDNLGVNLDPANLIKYGKANPLDALDIIGHLVEAVHAKDGEYPSNVRQNGPDRFVGEGRVNFPALIAKLRALGYAGPITIECEFRGSQQLEGIARARRILEPLL